MPLFLPDTTYAALQSLPGRRRSRGWVSPGTSGPAPPTYALEDAFTDSNGVNLTAHTPTVSGGAWSLTPGGSGTALINNNRIYSSVANAILRNSATPGSADYDVAGQMVPLSVDHNTSWGVIGRASSVADTYYLAFLYGFSGSFSLLLSKFVTGGYTQIGSGTLPSQPTLGTAHEVKLRMVGTSISVYYDGVLNISPVTDSSITAAGFAGVYLGAAGTTTSGVHIDGIIAA